MLVSINDLTSSQLTKILDRAMFLKHNGFQKTLEDKIIASLFFEPSTRTKMSFDAAILRTGAKILDFPSGNSSLKKGETLEDTIRMTSSYADLIIMRHQEETASSRAKSVSNCPIINAGNGKNEHPTQTILDLFTILEQHKSLDDFTITLVGDLKHSRTIHSLIYAIKSFTNAKVVLASPNAMRLSEEFKNILGGRLIKETNTLKEALKSDFVYMTRVQKERFVNPNEAHYEDEWILTLSLLQEYASPTTKILHPLPRVNEIHTDIDDTPYQLYFEQAKNGLYTRVALLEYFLGGKNAY